jgi:8-oxo-dGTP pyrophosphatase MutT (NUDIX family)
MFKENNYCNNCGKNGHAFQHCKQPITSVGIIAYRKSQNSDSEKELQYLMICRKDTIGFVEFVRGKYSLHNNMYLQTIISEMTLHEKQRIVSLEFDILWHDLWGDNVNTQYRSEEKSSRDKFETLKNGIVINGQKYCLQSLVANSVTEWQEPEWGFPKGRHNYQEKDIACAFREFEEETGYDRIDLNVIQNVLPFEEIFTGSNYKPYKHKYFIAGMRNESKDPQGVFQSSEVSKLEWKSYENVLKSIRPYNLEKKNIITRVNKLLLEYRLYP